MRRLGIGIALVAGCYRGPVEPAVTQLEHVPEVRFAIADDRAVRIVRTTDYGLVVERDVAVPGSVSQLFWAGPDPAVWIGASVPWSPGVPSDDDGVENGMGLVTARGFDALAPLAWPDVPKPVDVQFGDTASAIDATILMSNATELWQGHCSWYGGPDGGWCLHFAYARRVPAPVVFSDQVPSGGTVYHLPEIPAARAITTSFTVRKRHPDEPDLASWENDQDVLHCQIGGRLRVYPPADEPELGFRRLDWLSQDPPIFVIKGSYPYVGVGAASPPVFRVFEGCALSTRYGEAAAGPQDVVVLFGTQLSVRWHGREIGHLPRGGSLVKFAP